MEIELLEKRQAIAGWRDRLVLGIWRVVNHAGTEAKAGVERHLAEAGIVDSLWDPANFTRERIDGVMRASVSSGLEGLFVASAQELRPIDPKLGALADVLVESLAEIRMPEIASPGKDTSEATKVPSEPVPQGRLAWLLSTVTDRQVVQGARDWGSWALDKVSDASDAASQKLQSGTGLHERLRRSAQERISTVWMGTSGEPHTLMTQVLGVAEEIGSEARSMSL